MFVFYTFAVGVALLVYYYLLRKEDKTGEPPGKIMNIRKITHLIMAKILQFCSGPKTLPILGNLLDLIWASSNMTQSLGILAEKWGEIYTLQMGTKKTGWYKLNQDFPSFQIFKKFYSRADVERIDGDGAQQRVRLGSRSLWNSLRPSVSQTDWNISVVRFILGNFEDVGFQKFERFRFREIRRDGEFHSGE